MKEQARKIAEDLESLLCEFYRENKSKKGSGYGRRLMVGEILAFAKEIAGDFAKYLDKEHDGYLARTTYFEDFEDWWEQKENKS